jgi:hypothetical protein
MKTTSGILLIALSVSLNSCTNVTLLGHVVAYDINAEFKGDPVVPVGMNAGFESRSFVAVPPKNSVDWQKNMMSGGNGQQNQPYTLPKGDVLPTISKLKIESTHSTEAYNNIAFDFVSSGATGEAAIAAAGGTPPPATGGDQATDLKVPDKARKIADEIETISNSTDSIPKP